MGYRGYLCFVGLVRFFKGFGGVLQLAKVRLIFFAGRWVRLQLIEFVFRCSFRFGSGRLWLTRMCYLSDFIFGRGSRSFRQLALFRLRLRRF
jgi:hypothetical protein